MTWSISFSSVDKETAKKDVTHALASVMLSQREHAADFNVVQDAFHKAIDACADGSFCGNGYGHVRYDYTGVESGRHAKILGVEITISVSSGGGVQS